VQVNNLVTRNAGHSNANRKHDLGALTRSISRDASRGDRAVIGGFNPNGNQITYYSIGTLGNSVDFGDKLFAGSEPGALAGHGRGVYAGVQYPSPQMNNIDYISIGQRGNAADFGELAPNEPAMASFAPISDGIRGVLGRGGSTPVEMQFFNIMTVGNAVDWGANSNVQGRNGQCGNMANGHRGIMTGGYPSPNDAVDYITIGIAGTATDFGEKTASGARFYNGVGGNGHRCLSCQGTQPSPEVNTDAIEAWNFTSGGNSVDFGECVNGATNSSIGADDGSRLVLSDSTTKHYINIGVFSDSVDYDEETLHTADYGRGLSG